MKRYYLLTLLLAFFASTLFAQTNYEMVVEKTDGTKTYFNNNDIKQVYFQKVEEDNSPIQDLLLGDDSDFEGGSMGNWSSWGSYGQASINSPGYKSNYCVALSTITSGDGLAGQIIYNFKSYLQTGKTYRIQFYAKSNLANLDITFRYQNDTYTHQSFNVFNIGADWKLCQYDFVIPAEHWDINQITIDFSSVVSTFYVDNIRFGVVEGSTNPTINASGLVGTWKDAEPTWTQWTIFNSDYTGRTWMVESDGSIVEDFTFTWTLSGNVMTITPTGGDYSEVEYTTITIVSVNSTTLVINNGERTYTSTKVNGGDTPDNPSTGTYQGAKRVFGDVLLNNIYNVNDNITEAYTYDSNGFPTKITSTGTNRNYTMIPSYSDNQVIVKMYDGDTFKSQYVITIGSMGYATKIEYVNEKGNPETATLTYNDDEQLSTIMYGDDDVIQLTYSDGDVIRVNDNGTISDIAYETVTQSKILNSGSFMLWDETLPVDLDDMQELHWFGLLGKPTKHLPLSYVKYGSSDTKYHSNHYETDGNGRVTRFYYTTSYGSGSSHDSDVLQITWNY